MVRYADTQKCRLVIGADTNAHSQLFGPETNTRGEALEDLIFAEGLFVENQGEIPTFEAWRNDQHIATCIDATMTKGEVEILDWEVDTGYNGSDHNDITWTLREDRLPLPLIRPWHKAKWDVFTKKLTTAGIEIPETLDAEGLDQLLENFYEAVEEALQLACPKQEAGRRKSKTDWYTEDLRKLSAAVRRQYNTSRRTRSAVERIKYLKIQKKYKKACRRAKRRSWRYFLETTPDETKMATVDKIINRKNQNKISTFLKDDGSTTQPGKETLQLLLNTHFPAATEGEQQNTTCLLYTSDAADE